ncbi:MAG: hypothetical protein ACI4ES_06660 [Roseburia sp.]
MSSRKTTNIYDDGNIPDVDLPNGEDSQKKTFNGNGSAKTTSVKNTLPLPKAPHPNAKTQR